MASIISMPLELLVMVSSQLDTKDLGSLRRTCKAIEKLLFDFFAKEFFSKRQFMLTHTSLQALIDISKHPGLAAQLQHVIIGLEVYSRNSNYIFCDEESCARYVEGEMTQLVLLNSGQARDMLEEAFRRLPHLKTIGIRDTNIRTRGREKSVRWSSYGVRTVERETGQRIMPISGGPVTSWTGGSTQTTSGHDFVVQVFHLALLAAARAIKAPEEVEILLFAHDVGLKDTAFHLTQYSLPVLEPVLSKMKALLLALDLLGRPSYGNVAGTPCRLCPGFYLRSFLAHTSGLTHLRLNFIASQTKENEQFLLWLADDGTTSVAGQPTQSLIMPSPPPISLRNLKRLDLGTLDLRPGLLPSVIKKFAPTLKSFSLWRITLYTVANGGNIPEPYTRSKSLWANVLADLSCLPGLKLEYFMIGKIQLRANPFQTVNVEFYDSPHDQDADYDISKEEMKKLLRGELRLPTLSKKERAHCSGNGTMKFLGELVERLHVNWPYNFHDSSEEDNESNDNDEDMADEDDHDGDEVDEDGSEYGHED